MGFSWDDDDADDGVWELAMEITDSALQERYPIFLISEEEKRLLLWSFGIEEQKKKM